MECQDRKLPIGMASTTKDRNTFSYGIIISGNDAKSRVFCIITCYFTIIYCKVVELLANNHALHCWILWR